MGANVPVLWGSEGDTHQEVGVLGFAFRMGAELDALRVALALRTAVLADFERSSSRSSLLIAALLSPRAVLARGDVGALSLRPELSLGAEFIAPGGDASEVAPAVELGVSLCFEASDDFQRRAIELRVAQTWLIGVEDPVLGLGPIHNVSLSYSTAFKP